MKSEMNILLVDDHSVVRKGLELVVADSLPKAIIYGAENYSEALEILKTVDVKLVILDIIINGIEDVKIMKEIKKIQPNTKILVFSCHEEAFYGLRYISNGGDGFLNKFCSENTIIEAIRNVIGEGFYYSENIKGKLGQKSKKKYSQNPVESLSNREFEIAKLLVDGCGNLEIANKLNIQMSTVSTYKNRVFEKLDINNIVALSSFFKDNAN